MSKELRALTHSATSRLLTKEVSRNGSSQFHLHFIAELEVIRVPVRKDMFFNSDRATTCISATTIFNPKSVETRGYSFSILTIEINNPGI